MQTQFISLILLRGLLAHQTARAAWRDGIYVQASRFGGGYRSMPSRKLP